MENNCKEYAKELLKKCGCNLDCYKGTGLSVIESDLEFYNKDNPNDLQYPVKELAICLREIGDEQPDPPRKGHKQFCMIWDNDECTAGDECDTFEEAKDAMLETYTNWICFEQLKWECDEKGIPHPTEKQIEDWDYMIYNSTCWITEWDEEQGDYHYSEKMNYDFMSDEEANEIDWLEWEELKKKYNW